jgi:hypothetical protein
MKKPAFLSLMMVLMAASVWADVADDLNDVTAGLKSLVEPMEKKLDDCDEQVSEAEDALKESKSQIDRVLAVRDKLWQNIDRLRNSLLKQASKIEIEGEFFCREAVAQALGNLLEKYESNDEILTQLQGQFDAQKSLLQEAIAKQQRWRAKETELLEKISRLQDARNESINDDVTHASKRMVQEAMELQTDVIGMLEKAKNSKAKQIQVPPAPSGSVAPKTLAGTQTQRPSQQNGIDTVTEPASKPSRSKGASGRPSVSISNQQKSRPIPAEPIRRNPSRSTRGKVIDIDVEAVGRALDDEDHIP